jgi:hypothetical protein
MAAVANCRDESDSDPAAPRPLLELWSADADQEPLDTAIRAVIVDRASTLMKTDPFSLTKPNPPVARANTALRWSGVKGEPRLWRLGGAYP